MIDRTDPERPRSSDERVVVASCQFARGQMTEAVYRASLYAAGMRGDAIETEVRLNRPFRSLAEVSAPILNGFVSGLPR